MNASEKQNIIRELAISRRCKALAKAYLRRAKDAQIPHRFLRINKQSFKELLFIDYYKNDETVSKITPSPPRLRIKSTSV